MKLLLDENLSFRLVRVLQLHFPDTKHVKEIGLSGAEDLIIWDYARSHGFTIVSKDADFHQLAFLKGGPPKVIWIQQGNCTTDKIAEIIVGNRSAIQSFMESEETVFLALG
jgi:predicted nuclease of predicted toxin-antitoxin system